LNRLSLSFPVSFSFLLFLLFTSFAFFLGNRDKSPCPDLDKYYEVKSDPSEMIEANPEMKAKEVKNVLLEVLNQKKFKFLRVNFANGDMVGHTGNFESAKIAAEAVNDCVKELVAKTKELKGIVIVTADHGNLENMNDFRTSHTLNKVPFIIVDSRFKSNFVINTNIMEPGLGNIAATIINLLGYKKPSNFLSSLIEFRA
jgi:2,3-bisphosphoglycerate-independent phosphoglycerate mutase